MIITVRFVVRPQYAEAFLERVRRQAADSLRLEPGCRRFDVGVDESDRASVFLYEIYDDDQAFALHLESGHFRSFDRDTADWVLDKSVQRWSGPLG